MFDIGATELLVIVIVAILVIGPGEMPRAMRTAGRWVGQIRRVSAHFRSGIDAMVREAELEDMEKKWKAQNEEIMKKSAANAEASAGEPVMTGPPPIADDNAPDPMADDPAPAKAVPGKADKADKSDKPGEESAKDPTDDQAPELPLAPRAKSKD